MPPKAQIRVDVNSPEPVYRQIAGQVRALIVEGALATGDSLPAVRRLAMDLGVHFNTVAEAYRQLAEEGLLEVAQGKAARVKGPKMTAPAPEQMAGFRQRLRHMVAEMRAAGMSASGVRRELYLLLSGEEQASGRAPRSKEKRKDEKGPEGSGKGGARKGRQR